MDNFKNERPHILFICGRNQWRSPTAEKIYRKDERVFVRSAGISSKKGHQVSEKDLLWADLVLVMEGKYKSWISGHYRNIDLPPIKNLDIPDEFQYMDEELIKELELGVEYYIENFNLGE